MDPRAWLKTTYDSLLAAYGPQGWWPAKSGFEMAIGAILTQNTAWANVERAIENLDSERLLNPKRLARAERRRVELCVRPAGFYRQKAERIQRFARYLMDRYDGELDNLLSQDTQSAREELLAFNGIGPETADSILLYARGHPVFVVDAYTRRLLSRTGLFSRAKPDYETIQTFLEGNLPQDYKIYQEFHALIVRLAKEKCRAKPECKGCPLERGCAKNWPSPASTKNPHPPQFHKS